MTGPLEEAERLAASAPAVDALRAAWRALDLNPDGAAEKRLVSNILQREPELAEPARRDDLRRLLRDPALDPTHLARAGWLLLEAEGALDVGEEALADRLEADSLALTLLEESFVPSIAAERALTGLRRFLLLSPEARERRPRLAAALVAQARHNDGAWWIAEEERERLAAVPDFAAAYLPPRPSLSGGAGFDDPVTGEVAAQYEGWPYPAWTRAVAPQATTLTALVRHLDPDGGDLPAAARILNAGCGTGREAATLAIRFPDAQVTAIDISRTSLAYAAERCAGLGIDFRRLDLHRAAQLGRRFHLVSSSGVLHHLPDPEAGWAALADVLELGGVMRIMLYSRVARLRVRAARTLIGDLLARPVTDHLLREARCRLIEKAPHLLGRSLDFYTLGGVHDLLFHVHEDPFDVPRIRAALDRLGLRLLAFVLPTAAHRARYLEEHPYDPHFRDFEAWAALEKTDPFLFAGMYEFWCRKPG